MAEFKIEDLLFNEELGRSSGESKNIRKDEKPSEWIKRLKDSKS